MTPPSAKHAKTLRKRLLTDLASYDTVSKRIRDLPLPDGAPPGGSQDRLQRALAARGQLYLSDKLGLLRSLGNVEELSGSSASAKGKKAAGGGAKDGEYTVKTLASLLDKDDVDRVTERVGPELEAAAKLNVLRECVLVSLPLSRSRPGSALTLPARLPLSPLPQARSTRPVVRRRRQLAPTVRGRGGAAGEPRRAARRNCRRQRLFAVELARSTASLSRRAGLLISRMHPLDCRSREGERERLKDVKA